MRLLRTIRLDSSDLSVFETAATPGEWAVPGTFAFALTDPETMTAKQRLAFASGWLGTASFGRATLVEVAEIDEAGYFAVVERLARHFVDRYGAPSLGDALPAAREEADYAAGLCEHRLNTLLAVERELTDEGIAERFRVIIPERVSEHTKIWGIVPDEDATG